MKDKKITIFLPNLSGGGAEKVMITIANELSKEYIIDLVAVRAVGIFSSEISPSVNLINLNGKMVTTSLFKLIKYLNSHKPDYFISALLTSNVISVLAKIFSRKRFKLILTEHAVASEAISDASSRWFRFFLPEMIRATYKLANQIVTVSEGVSDDLVENFGIDPKKIKVIYNPVVSDEITKKSNETLENPYFDHSKIPMILGVGRLTSQKNFSLLIRAFHMLLKKKEAKLVILGEGPLLEDLKELSRELNIEDDVYFPGFQKNPYNWMKEAELFVLSSNYEGLGNVLIESMACGTEVISTDCDSGPYEILEGGKWGKLCPVDDSRALSSAMLESLNENNIRDISERASFFNIQGTIDGYESLFEEKQKIAIFLPTLAGGGAERAMITISNGLGKKYAVDLVVSNASGSYRDEIDNSVKVVDLKSKSLRWSFFKLISYINSEKPDTVISALASANIVCSVARIFTKKKFKLILSERAAVIAALKDNPRWQARIMPFLIKMTYPYADFIVCVAKDIANELIEVFGLKNDKVKVIYNAVITEKLIEDSLKEFHNPYFDHSEIPMILGVGRLTSQKNFASLIHAFSSIRKKHKSKLVILGEGPLLDDLINLSKELNVYDDVYFPGFVQNPFVWMKHAKVFVLSSNYEGLPNALIQAMACGTQVVSTDCPTGPSEILEDGKWGFLCPVNDNQSLAQGITNILENDTQVDVFKRSQYFSLGRALEGYEQLI